jgi:hypothetical protein
LELGISLVFGAWFLVFRFLDFSGAWGLVLVFRSAEAQKPGCAPTLIWGNILFA